MACLRQDRTATITNLVLNTAPSVDKHELTRVDQNSMSSSSISSASESAGVAAYDCGFAVDERRVHASGQDGRRHVLWLATRRDDALWLCSEMDRHRLNRPPHDGRPLARS